jgi:hypothetical protein
MNLYDSGKSALSLQLDRATIDIGGGELRGRVGKTCQPYWGVTKITPAICLDFHTAHVDRRVWHKQPTGPF